MVKFKDRVELLGPAEYGAVPDHDEYIEPMARIKCSICGKLFLTNSAKILGVCNSLPCVERMSQHYRMKNMLHAVLKD